MNDLVLIAIGLISLVAGAELVVRGATRLALSLGVKPLVLGITIVAIGTSAPELAIGVTAGMRGEGALAVANIAGTNVFNIMFILCLSAIIKPLPLHTQIIKLELPVIIFSSLLMIICALDGNLSRIDGIIMFIAGIVYTLVIFHISKDKSPHTKQNDEEVFDLKAILRWNRFVKTKPGYCVILLIGITLTVFGAKWLVDGAVSLALSLGVSKSVIGLTIVALGTSAPELVTTVLSTIKGDRDVAVGNILGSSIYNILIILGFACIIAPSGLPVEEDVLLIDIPLMVGMAIACFPVFVTGREISRFEGSLGVGSYLVYLVWLLYNRS